MLCKKFYLYVFLLGGLFSVCVVPISSLGLPYETIYGILSVGILCFTIPCFFAFLRVAPTKKTGFLLGYFFGVGQFLVGLYWIANPFLIERDMFLYALPFGVIGLPALLAVYFGCLGWLFVGLRSYLKFSVIGQVVLFCFLYGSLEWVRSFLLTGFGWGMPSLFALHFAPFSQVISLVNALGGNFLIISLSFAGFFLLKPYRHLYVASVIMLLWGAIFLYGTLRLVEKDHRPSQEDLWIRIIQPDIPQRDKWQKTTRATQIKTLLDLTAKPSNKNIAWVIWPEAALPILLEEHIFLQKQILAILPDGAKLLTGSLRREQTPTGEKVFNSIFMLDETGAHHVYDKMRLVPFGEYIPLAFVFKAMGLEKMMFGLEGLSAGKQKGQAELLPARKSLLLICYEIIFPLFGLIKDESLIINVSNDAWFGKSIGLYQHFAFARVRALETGLPIMRVANKGISGLVDGKGQVVSHSSFLPPSFLPPSSLSPSSLPSSSLLPSSLPPSSLSPSFLPQKNVLDVVLSSPFQVFKFAQYMHWVFGLAYFLFVLGYIVRQKHYKK